MHIPIIIIIIVIKISNMNKEEKKDFAPCESEKHLLVFKSQCVQTLIEFLLNLRLVFLMSVFHSMASGQHKKKKKLPQIPPAVIY